VGAHCIGDKAWIKGDDRLVPGWRADFFQRGEQQVLVLRRVGRSSQPLDRTATAVTLEVEPRVAGSLTVTNVWGRSRVLAVQMGRAQLDLTDDLIFVDGARKLAIGRVEVARP
jgi:hypothetical protein